MRIAFVSIASPYDRTENSGTMYTISHRLMDMGHEVVWAPVKRSFLYKKADWLCYQLSKIKKSVYTVEMTPLGLWLEARSLEKELRKIGDYDLIFSCIHSSSLCYARIDKPLIYLSDATFAVLNNYYYSGLSKYCTKYGHLIEQRAMDKATDIILSSDWSAKSAINDYCQPKEKIHVIEFGANIDDKDIIPHKFIYEGHLHLLFIGVDWKRKGGELAVKTCEWLNNNGQPATLHIIGAKNLSQDIQDLPYIDYVGFINKNDPKDYKRFIEVVQQCHCMLLPTKAECSAIAFCESSAYGLPVFSHLTGGCANYVLEGKNGHLLPLGSTPQQFGEAILAYLHSGEMKNMSLNCIQIYNDRLSWRAWGERVNKIINKYDR